MFYSFLIEFIEEYKKFPCLWRIKSVEYRDRNLKNKAYEHLLKTALNDWIFHAFRPISWRKININFE
jgi:sulfatase maturation enzyme AslB (radical SAM superfamily)